MVQATPYVPVMWPLAFVEYIPVCKAVGPIFERVFNTKGALAGIISVSAWHGMVACSLLHTSRQVVVVYRAGEWAAGRVILTLPSRTPDMYGA